MDQNGNGNQGNDGSNGKTIGSVLERLANERRERERTIAEARQNGGTQTQATIWNKPEPIKAEPEKSTEVLQATDNPKLLSESETDINEILNSSEAAKLLGYTEKSFRNMVSAGKIPHYRLFGQNRFKKIELLGLLVKVETA